MCILGADENVTPLKRDGEIKDMEEERRLFYVAMTRAREELVILSASGSGFGADGKGYDSGHKRQNGQRDCPQQRKEVVAVCCGEYFMRRA